MCISFLILFLAASHLGHNNQGDVANIIKLILISTAFSLIVSVLISATFIYDFLDFGLSSTELLLESSVRALGICLKALLRLVFLKHPFIVETPFLQFRIIKHASAIHCNKNSQITF